ncbi:unnamed protein product, partial [Prorocentrum cordatum]
MAVVPYIAELMRDAAQEDAEANAHEYLDEEAQCLNTNLYYILVVTVEDKAEGIVNSVPAGAGLEALRLLCVEFDPKVPSRVSGMLGSILYPRVQENDPIKGIVPWQTLLKRYEEQTGKKVMESTEKSVLSAMRVPDKLREHLGLHEASFTTCAKFS